MPQEIAALNKRHRLEDLLEWESKEIFASLSDEDATPVWPPPPFKIEAFNAAAIEAPRPIEYLIKDIIEPHQVSQWFGPAGNGKTFLLLHLAYAIAQGRQVFGRRVRQADTLYLALEGRGGIRKRVYAMFKSMGPASRFWLAPQSLELLQIDQRGGTRLNTEHVDALVSYIGEKAIKFVVIDTLNLTLGGAQENDNSVMGMLIKAAGDIAMITGAHVAFVAHSSKAGIDSGPRGGSAQKGNADLVVSVSGEGVLTASSRAPAGKIKDGAPFDLYFKLKPEELLTDPDGDVMTSCTVEEVDAPEATTRNHLTPRQQGWLTAIEQLFRETGRNAPVSRQISEGLTALTLTRDQVRDALRRQGLLGHVGSDGGLSNAARNKLYESLKMLKSKGKINMTQRLVWLVT